MKLLLLFGNQNKKNEDFIDALLFWMVVGGTSPLIYAPGAYDQVPALAHPSTEGTRNDESDLQTLHEGV